MITQLTGEAIAWIYIFRLQVMLGTLYSMIKDPEFTKIFFFLLAYLLRQNSKISPMILSPALPLRPNSSGYLSGSVCETWSPRLGGLGDPGPAGLDAQLTQGWRWGRAWGPGPEAAASWDLSPLSQNWDLGGWTLSLGTLHIRVRTENKMYLVEICRTLTNLTVTGHRDKGSDT